MNNSTYLKGIKSATAFLACTTAGLLALAGCSGKKTEPAKRTFPMITVPTVYNAPQARAEYLAMHYWDRFDFGDTVNIGSAAPVSEQAIVDYISTLPYASYGVVYEGIHHTLSMAERHPAMYAFFTSMMERYLFDLNSSLRNDEYFIPVLEHMLSSTVLDDYRKARPGAILFELQKNRPGTQAADIRYATASGARAALSQLTTDYTLAMFHNLDCGNCRQLAAAVDASTVIREMQRRKMLTVLSIYHGDDIDGWTKHVAEMPPSWIHGYDYAREIADSATYALRIIPTLYLFRRDRTVVMRDATLEYVEYFLNSAANPPAIAGATAETTQ
ncbi:MAG: DUF5106 domain-containing protein [Tannerella sp.]|jgi:hypothetical protein|nr:DUF5106 domain-containing protein [Tannerella sp.]